MQSSAIPCRALLAGLSLLALAALPGGAALAADRGAAAAKVDPKAPVFIKLPALNVTVFDRGAQRGRLTVELQLDVLQKPRLAQVEAQRPRLADGFLAAMTEYANSRAAAERAPDLDYLADQLQKVTDKTLGAAGIAKVLIHTAVRTL